jgi:hypothetical protein
MENPIYPPSIYGRRGTKKKFHNFEQKKDAFWTLVAMMNDKKFYSLLQIDYNQTQELINFFDSFHQATVKFMPETAVRMVTINVLPFLMIYRVELGLKIKCLVLLGLSHFSCCILSLLMS